MEDLIKQIKDQKVTLLDVRSPMEFEGEHAPGAINIPLDTIEQNISTIAAMQKPIVVYCLSGGRSGAATSILQLNGVTEVYNGGGVYNILSIINN
jgi:phage shock protein E